MTLTGTAAYFCLRGNIDEHYDFTALQDAQLQRSDNSEHSGECSVPRAVGVTVYVRTEITTGKVCFSGSSRRSFRLLLTSVWDD